MRLGTRGLIGDRAFYKRVLSIAVPIMIQNGITNFVNLLDNIMVGSLSTEAMSGVSIVNQFIFVFNLIVFGAVSAAGIFCAQFHGNNDTDGVRYTFRFKLISLLSVGVICVIALSVLGDTLIGTFLHLGSEEVDLGATLEYGRQYLGVMLIGLVPTALAQAYGSTMRETGNTVIPMIASIATVATNFVLNLLLIFGLLGFPALGVVGAAIATVAARFVELLIMAVYTHTHAQRLPYIKGAFASLRIPASLVRNITKKAIPLVMNEFVWSIAITVRNQCYSTRGLDAVAAQNIFSTLNNLFNITYMSVSAAIAIILGNLLGAGRIEEARDSGRKMIAFAVFCSLVMAAVMASVGTVFPMIYNTTEAVRELASFMILIAALMMPFAAFANASYFTFRSGGKMLITIIFDSGYMSAVVLPVCLISAYLTDMSIFTLFVVGQGAEIFKSLIALHFLRSGSWARRIITDKPD